MSDDAAIDALLEPADGGIPSAAGGLVVPCPYLLSANGAWRSSSVSRDHRCAAVAPAAPLALDKQRRLCLVSAHVSCATHEAALAARRERGMPSDGTAPVRWAVARTTPVVDVGVGLGAAVSGLLADRRAWQAIPAIVLAVALVAVALSGLGRDEPLTGAVASSTPTLVPAPTRSPSPTPVPTPRPSATPEPTGTPAPTPTPTVAPTPVPTATPAPTARTSYRVKSGDTLYGIAGSFGTTVAAIKELNGLTSNTLHVGQVLLIP
jgi:LysM repeat protein